MSDDFEMDSGDCGACLEGEANGSWECFSERMVRARVKHKCLECGDEIKPGSTYQRVSGKWEGEFSSMATCAPCAAVRAALYCDVQMLGCLWSDCSEAIFPDMTRGCIAKVKTAEGRAKLVERWQKWKGLAA